MLSLTERRSLSVLFFEPGGRASFERSKQLRLSSYPSRIPPFSPIDPSLGSVFSTMRAAGMEQKQLRRRRKRGKSGSFLILQALSPSLSITSYRSPLSLPLSSPLSLQNRTSLAYWCLEDVSIRCWWQHHPEWKAAARTKGKEKWRS